MSTDPLGGIDWVEINLNTWKHPQPLFVVAGGSFPNFVVMFLKKVEQEQVAH